MDSQIEVEWSPWVTIWTQPRATIRKILDDPGEWTGIVWLLAAAGGIQDGLSAASQSHAADRLPLALALFAAVIFGAIAGVIRLGAGAWLLRIVGGWLGGIASPDRVRAAMGWSNVPATCLLVLWIPRLALFGGELFTEQTPRWSSSGMLALAGMGFRSTELMLGVWGFVIFLKCLGEAQGFSTWRAFLNVLLVLAGLVGLAFFLIMFALVASIGAGGIPKLE